MLFAQKDLSNVLGFVSRLYSTLGAQHVDIDVAATESVLGAMRDHLTKQGGIAKASPFKKAATFLCHFIEAAPIKTPLPANSNLVRGLTAATGTEPNPNVVVGLRLAMESLHRAKLRRSDGEEHEFSRRLDLSGHSYVDIVDTLNDATPRHFKYVAVLLEQLAYKTNPRCQYPSYQVANLDSPERQLADILDREDMQDVWAGRAQLLVKRVLSHDLDLDEVVAAMADNLVSNESGAVPRKVAYYRQSQANPDLVDRVAPDGAVTTGKILDGIFVEAETSAQT